MFLSTKLSLPFFSTLLICALLFLPAPIAAQTLGYIELVELLPGAEKEGLFINATIDTGAEGSSIDKELVAALNLPVFDTTVTVKSSLGKEERETTIFDVYLGGERRTITATIADREELSTPLLIGRRDLSGFFIDPSTPHSSANNPSRKLLLIIPLLASLIVFFRRVIGIKTYGVFAPLIISVALVYTSIYLGSILYLVLLLIGVLLKKLLSPYALPRITQITLLLFFTSLAFFFFNQFTFIFPIIITAYLMEQISRQLEHNAAKEVVVNVFSTIFVAILLALCTTLLQNQTYAFLALLLLLSLVLLFFSSTYVGLRLLERRRFRSLLTGHLSVLGLNMRNYWLNRLNDPLLVAQAKNKFLTLQMLVKASIMVPQQYFHIVNSSEIPSFHDFPRECVVKPAQGSGGAGILILKKQGNYFFTPSKKRLTYKGLCHHIKKILDGDYALSAQEDTVLIEERIYPHNSFKANGLPDVRIICKGSEAILAMLRYPTEASDGKANLHAGALGVGIAMRSGKLMTPYCVQTKQRVSLKMLSLPEKIPSWNSFVNTAESAASASGLYFCGVDLVLTKDGRIVVLEINGHPGIEIQNVNNISLFDFFKKEFWSGQ